MSLTAAQRNTIATWLAGAWTKIQARQTQYLSGRGSYRQFKFSHTVAPQNAAAVIPNSLTDQPTNETDGVTLTHADGGLGWPVRVRVDVYAGPNGVGYVAVAQARGSTGERWEAARQVGPETWRERALAQVAALLIAFFVTGCAPCRWDGVMQADSLARHHSAVRVGPRATWANGTQVTLLGGHQQAIWEPGEPHYSERAPTDEWQVSLEVVVPLGGRR